MTNAINPSKAWPVHCFAMQPRGVRPAGASSKEAIAPGQHLMRCWLPVSTLHAYTHDRAVAIAMPCNVPHCPARKERFVTSPFLLILPQRWAALDKGRPFRDD